MKIGEKIKCLLGKHEWEKFMGLRNVGRGKFAQKYVCRKCKKMKDVVK